MINLLCLCIGIFSVSLLPSLSLPLLVFLGFLFFLSYYFRYYSIVFLSVGFLIGFLQAHTIVDQQWPAALDGELVELEGYVASLPTGEPSKQRFLLRVINASLYSQKNTDIKKQSKTPINANNKLQHSLFSNQIKNKIEGKLVQLSWYRYGSKWHHKNPESLPKLSPGQSWRWVVKLRRPRGFVNPASFDYQVHLLQQSIIATGYIVDRFDYHYIANNCYQAWMACLRGYVLTHLQSVLGVASNTTTNTGALIIALLTGHTDGLSNDQWRLLRNTGTIHLMAISGLHIGLAASIGFGLGTLLIKLINLVHSQQHYGRYFPALLSIIFALSYSILAGFSLPTQRAFIMVLVFHVFSIFYRSVNGYFLLIIALTVIAVYDPLAVMSAGFWMSFLAVALLFYAFSWRNNNAAVQRTPRAERSVLPVSMWMPYVRPLWVLCKAQWFLFLGLFLPSLLFFQGVSLYAPLANLVAVALVSSIIVPLLFLVLLFLLWAPSVSQWFLSLADAAIVFMWSFLEWLDTFAIPFWHVPLSSPSVMSIVLVILGVLWMLSPRGIPYRYIGIFLCLPMFFAPTTRSPLTITFLDVGQGTAIVIETKEHRLVYDTGRRYSARFNAGEHIITPYLRARGYSHIDKLIVSHSDSDHAGGVSGLLAQLSVSELLLGQPVKTSFDTASLKVPINTRQQCIAGQQWQWDGVAFEILWPSGSMVNSTRVNNNNTSCVLLVTYQGKQILLSGDIERKAERQLHYMYPHLSNIDILLVPHHGSRTSSGVRWLKTLRPHWAVVTAGYRNAYNHPHPEIVGRYQQVGTILLNTALTGALRWHLDKQGRWHLERWRVDYKRYWYH